MTMAAVLGAAVIAAPAASGAPPVSPRSSEVTPPDNLPNPLEDKRSALRQTAIARVLGLPLPALGLTAFAVLGALALFRGERARVGHLVVGAAGSVVAASLIYTQIRMGVFCKYCLVADAAALLVLAGAALRVARSWDPPPEVGARVGLGAAMAAAIVAPLGIGFAAVPARPPLPAVIAAEIARTPKGQVTVIDFVDFECPFCRMTHAEVAPLVAEHRSQVRLVRKQVPLSMHPHAMDAARAACCGEALGEGDVMADALFTAAVDDLTRDGCEKIAAALGLDPARYRACVADPKTDEKIRADTDEFHASHGRGLPTIWIGDESIEGARDGSVYAAAMERALASR